MELVHALLVISSVLNVASAAPQITTISTAKSTTKCTTPGPQEINLNGKMFTLSEYGGGISFCPPYFSPICWISTPSYSSSPYYTTTYVPTSTPWTTAPTMRSVSVCLRYLTDFAQTSYPRIFTLSPSSTPLQLTVDQLGGYTLNFNSYGYTMYLKPNIRFWSNIGPDIWSRVCFTLDFMKNVAQVFSGSNISIRKVIPDQYGQYVWSGEPVIEFKGFDGQVTDVQMWDYPLSYKEVFNYMTSGVFGPYRGSVLTWSSISYTPSGDTLLEDVYERQAKQKIIGRRRGRRPKGGRKNRKFVNEEKEKKE